MRMAHFPHYRALPHRLLMRTASHTRIKYTHQNFVRSFQHTSQIQCPVIPFKLSDIGEGIAEVEVLQWFVKKGDHVKQFENVCEVQSDKATVEITSRYDGVVTKVHYEVGAMAAVGSSLIDIDVDEATASGIASTASNKTSSTNEETVHESPVTSIIAMKVATGRNTTAESEAHITQSFQEEVNGHDHDKVLTSPSVRRLAREHQVSLHDVQGTGEGGRVLKADILAHIRDLANKAKEEEQKRNEVKARRLSLEMTSEGAPPVSYLQEDTIVTLTPTQRMMVKSMTAALQVPHFGYGDEIDMDALSTLRKTLKPLEETHQIKLSYMPFLLKAASLALRRFPMLNARVGECGTQVTMIAAHNISVAIDTPHGLVVPNIKNVQDKTVVEIAIDLKRLQCLALENRLTPSDIAGGTFSLSNIGSIGGTYMSPVLFLPQVAIGAVGKIQVVPRYNAEALAQGQHILEPKRLMNVSWSGDHRVIDGATMARFSNEWKAFVEFPMSMLSEMK